MRIGLVGYYGWGNFGDELFSVALRAQLPDVKFVYLHEYVSHPYFGEEFEKRLDSVDAVLIGGGDLLIPWARSGLYWDERLLRKPVFVYGVGVPTWGGYRAEIVNFYRRFLNHPNVKLVSVRDPESAEWVARHLKRSDVTWRPDIVCSLNVNVFRNRDANADATAGLSARYLGYGHAVDEASQGLRRISEMLSRKYQRSTAIVLATGLTAVDDEGQYERLALPLEMSRGNSEIDLVSCVANLSLFVSMKFHGCVVGLMAGVPTVSIGFGDKFTNFYRMLGLEELVSSTSDPDIESRIGVASTLTLPAEKIHSIRNEATKGILDLRQHLQC